MNFVSLSKGKIKISFGEDKIEHTFKPADHERIGELIAKHGLWEFMCSSSCDFPHECGFKRGFNVFDVLREAVEYARAKVATAVEPVALAGAADHIEAVARANGSLPLSLRFLRSGKEGEDVVLTFKEQTDFDYFIAGIRYANRLTACTNGAPCSNESVSAKSSDAPTAATKAAIPASGRTKPAGGSRCTVGSVRNVGRSARTPKGASRANRR